MPKQNNNLLTIQSLQRMPYYLECLEEAKAEGVQTISATSIAKKLCLNDVLVRKDIAAVSKKKGRPKTGFPVGDLISDMKEYMGFNDKKKAVLIGAGSLGRALLGNSEFEKYGISIAAAFDKDKNLVGRFMGGVRIYSMNELEEYCKKNKIQVGIITTPRDSAQAIADSLVASGISAIWNFTLRKLLVPEDVLVQDENLASSLAMLSHHTKN